MNVAPLRRHTASVIAFAGIIALAPMAVRAQDSDKPDATIQFKEGSVAVGVG